MNGKYRKEAEGLCSREMKGRFWKAIRKKWGLVCSRISFLVGNRRRVKFWKDKWCGIASLGSSFSSLFALAISKDAWVKDVWNSFDPGEGGWSPCFSRPLNDWKVGSVERFLLHLDGSRVHRDDEDRMLWTKTKNGEFTMK